MKYAGEELAKVKPIWLKSYNAKMLLPAYSMTQKMLAGKPSDLPELPMIWRNDFRPPLVGPFQASRSCYIVSHAWVLAHLDESLVAGCDLINDWNFQSTFWETQ